MGHLRHGPTARPFAHDGEVDPLSASTVSAFAECLRAVRLRAGQPSYRELQRWGERHHTPLPRSTVRDALLGRRLPRKDLVLSFVRACGRPEDLRRWETAWTRLAARLDESRSTSRSAPIPPPGLVNGLDGAGLLRIGTTYLNEFDWARLFADVTELDIVVAYGQTWRNVHARELAQVAARPGSRIRVVLTDPDDAIAVAALADRFATTPAELCTRIDATRQSYTDLRRPDGATIEVYYSRGDRVFSFYRFDDVAVVGLYSHARHRSAPVPVFVCARPGGLYDFVQEELDAMLDHSRSV